MQSSKLIIEESLRPRIEALLPNNNDSNISTGLILAQLASDSSYWVMGLVPTPLKDESPNDDDEEEGEGNDEAKTKQTKSKKKGKNKSDELDEAWIAKHALEVGKMLTGGIHVAGVYIFDNSSTKRDDASICGVLEVIATNLPVHLQPTLLEDKAAISSWIGLRYDWKTSKCTAKVFSSHNNEELDYASGCTADIKYESFISKFQTLVCKYPINLEINLVRSKQTIEQQLKESISQTATHIMNSIPVVNGRAVLQNHSDLVSTLGVAATHDVDICSTWVTPAKRRVAQELPVVAQLRVNIQISGVAFALPKESLSFATQALKKDVVASLNCRIELLAKELLWKQDLLDTLQRSSETQPDEIFNLFQLSCSSELRYKDTMWMLPNRVLVPFSGPVCLCDYIFPYETKMDAIDRYSALLSLPTPDTPDDWLIVLESTTAAVGDLDQPALVSTPQKVLKRRHPHHEHHHEPHHDPPQHSAPHLERRTSVPKIEAGPHRSKLTAMFFPLLIVLCLYTAFLVYLGLSE
eukprot:TRINITY_DN3213_c0_g1_i1.p1 TRINITY_DN3213_c0_g1~~TRINITY_DN3213_c0_g1_i1.p1  ORF type:complete len:537 (+),score=103.36 TRINITY_DN3213_c0_g1_i1:43-1611(+)